MNIWSGVDILILMIYDVVYLFLHKFARIKLRIIDRWSLLNHIQFGIILFIGKCRRRSHSSQENLSYDIHHIDTSVLVSLITLLLLLLLLLYMYKLIDWLVFNANISSISVISWRYKIGVNNQPEYCGCCL